MGYFTGKVRTCSQSVYTTSFTGIRFAARHLHNKLLDHQDGHTSDSAWIAKRACTTAQ